MKKISIYVLGKDGMGWSIDKDRENIKKVLNDLGYDITKNFLKADIVLVVWWNIVTNSFYKFLKKIFKNKIWVAIVTNDISYQKENFNNAKIIMDFWIYANSQQKKFLLKNGIDKNHMAYNPFYVDETIFKKINMTKKEICDHLGIDYYKIKGKFLIGSFQRDSLGNNLLKPKWQKNPDLLVDIAKQLKNKNYNFAIVLAGPRRHYIIKRFDEEKLPYIFVGDMDPIIKIKDDICINNLPLRTINLLYNLVDVYLVTSKSEGGPKAIIEDTLTKTPILTTKVGMASDLLDDFSLCNNISDFIKKIEILMNDEKTKKRVIENNYKKVYSINNYEAFKRRIKKIIDMAINIKQVDKYEN